MYEQVFGIACKHCQLICKIISGKGDIMTHVDVTDKMPFLYLR